jgi:hypothetical protein
MVSGIVFLLACSGSNKEVKKEERSFFWHVDQHF